jgi:hypothetical protein
MMFHTGRNKIYYVSVRENHSLSQHLIYFCGSAERAYNFLEHLHKMQKLRVGTYIVKVLKFD